MNYYISICVPGGRWIPVLALASLLAGCAGTQRSADVLPRAAREAGRSVSATPREATGDPVMATGGPDGIEHVVLPRQTLWRIARAYGKSVHELARVNGIEDPTMLSAGQVLFIPGAAKELYVPPYAGSAPTTRSGILDESWTWPVVGGEVISVYGESRGNHRHRGLDIRGRPGQDVRAIREGRVVFRGTMRGYGKTVIVDHSDGLRSLYAHNSRLLVDDGQSVREGQPIASIGRSGNATTDHCHLELHRGGVAVDPLLYVARVSEASR